MIDYKNMEMWFARSKGGMLYVYVAEPVRDEEFGEWEELESENDLYNECYLDITWDNSPIKVSEYFKYE